MSNHRPERTKDELPRTRRRGRHDSVHQATTICEAFQKSVRGGGDTVALRTADGDVTITWREGVAHGAR